MKIPAFLYKLLSNQFRWIALVIVGIVLGLGYWLFISEKIQAIQTTGFVEKKRIQNDLATQQRYLDSLKASIGHFHAALPDDQLRAINDFIPSNPDFPGLLLTLNNIANAANLQLDSVDIGEIGQLAATSPTGNSTETAATQPPSAQAASAAGVNLQVQDAAVVVKNGSSYESFKRFITLVESSQRLMDVVSLNFNVSGSQSGAAGADQQFGIHIRTYYLQSGR
jgi:hypothetical protein